MKLWLKYLIITCLLFLIFAQLGKSQTNGNEWINYNQQYFKIHVSQDGIYRVSYASLLAAGVPVGSIDPRWIQIYYKGDEQYIHIHGEGTTGIFDPNGYIEFYGQRNRGELDLDFFDDPNNQVNPDYSFYNDTSAYFLTWNFSTSNRRMSPQNSTDYSPYISSAQSFCYRKIRENYTSACYWGSTRCLFTEGEGWFDNSAFTEDVSLTKNISVPNIFSGSSNATFEIAAVGAPANQVTSTVPHHLKVEFLGAVRIDETYSGYQFVKEQINIPSSQLASPISFKFTANDISEPDINDRNTVSFINIRYPHTWDFENQNYFEFFLPANASATKDYLEITNFVSSTVVYLYDLTNHERIAVQNSGGVLKTLVNYTNTERNLVLTNQSGIKAVDRITKVSPDNKFTDYVGLYPNADYLVITHESLWNEAQQYADYRTSVGFNVALVDVDQLYNQFAYGVNKHPASIRRYNQALYEILDRPRLMFLIGKSVHFYLARNSSVIYSECLVPSGGNPSSDNLLTAGLGNTEMEPLVGTGRLSAVTGQDVLNYLNKVIDYESTPKEEWMKTVLHFGGGSSVSEQTTFAYYLSNYENVIEDTVFGGAVSTFLKNSSEPIQITQSDSIRNLINNGATLMTFFGHGSASGFDQNIDFPETYENTGKYPFLLANSCFSGDIHQRYSGSISESWVKAVDKGSIGFLASIGQGVASYLNVYSLELYKNFSYKTYGLPVSLQIISAIKVIQIEITTGTAITSSAITTEVVELIPRPPTYAASLNRIVLPDNNAEEFVRFNPPS